MGQPAEPCLARPHGPTAFLPWEFVRSASLHSSSSYPTVADPSATFHGIISCTSTISEHAYRACVHPSFGSPADRRGLLFQIASSFAHLAPPWLPIYMDPLSWFVFLSSSDVLPSILQSTFVVSSQTHCPSSLKPRPLYSVCRSCEYDPYSFRQLRASCPSRLILIDFDPALPWPSRRLHIDSFHPSNSVIQLLLVPVVEAVIKASRAPKFSVWRLNQLPAFSCFSTSTASVKLEGPLLFASQSLFLFIA